MQLPIAQSTPTLSPVKQCKGRPTLLRPLYERKYHLLQASAVPCPTASTSVNKAQSTPFPPTPTKRRKVYGPRTTRSAIQVKTSILCNCCQATKAGIPYFICEYQQTSMREIRWKRGQTALGRTAQPDLCAVCGQAQVPNPFARNPLFPAKGPHLPYLSLPFRIQFDAIGALGGVCSAAGVLTNDRGNCLFPLCTEYGAE